MSSDPDQEIEEEIIEEEHPDVSTYQKIVVVLDGWEYVVDSHDLGDQVEQQEKKATILYEAVKDLDENATMGRHANGAKYVFRFSLFGESDEVLEAISDIMSQFTALVKQYSVLEGKASGVLLYPDGGREVAHAKLERGADLDEAFDAVMAMVYEKIGEEEPVEPSLSASIEETQYSSYSGDPSAEAGGAVSYVPSDEGANDDYFPSEGQQYEPDPSEVYQSDRNKRLWEGAFGDITVTNPDNFNREYDRSFPTKYDNSTKCPLCNKPFPSHDEMYQHYKIDHTDREKKMYQIRQKVDQEMQQLEDSIKKFEEDVTSVSS